jgi:rhomboid family GlyGly-CTERM serine protease
MWALFARDYSPLRWLAIYLFASLAISAGLWWFNPDLEWYVGASGSLHGVMTAGTLAHLRRGDLDGWILATFVIAKLAYEQFAGSMPFAGAANTIVDAHLYGAVGGLALALFLRSRPAWVAKQPG